MKRKLLAAVAAGILCLSATSAYANSSETASGDYSGYSALNKITATATPTATPSRTISTEGTGHVVDNITDSDDLQFISVTAKDGSVFFVVIDKQNTNDNVYFLNKVDISDLEALAKDNNLTSSITATPTPTATSTPEPDEKGTTTEQKQTKKSGSSTTLILILAAIAAAIIGGYYVKVILPKKKLEDADDLEDFEFVDGEDSEEVVNEDEEYSEDETENNI
jgi:hypothetical protein